jgi:hypothetical protein
MLARLWETAYPLIVTEQGWGNRARAERFPLPTGPAPTALSTGVFQRRWGQAAPSFHRKDDRTVNAKMLKSCVLMFFHVAPKC